MTENEDWFHESITRYKHLNMFELEYPVLHVEPTSINSICVASSKKKRHQLLELSLPVKLTSKMKNSLETAITNDTDLKIKCGTFIHSMITDLKTICNERKAVASHLKTNGVTVYNLSDDSDQIKRESFIKCQLDSPFLALNGKDLIVTKSINSSVLMIDINTGKIVWKVLNFPKESYCSKPLLPLYVDSSVVALCHEVSGQVDLHDTRSFKTITSFNTTEEKSENLWSFSSLQECSEKFSSSIRDTSLAMISKSGTLKVFDSRSWATPFVNKNLDVSSLTAVQLRFKPNNKWWVSVSGFDENVYVYKLDSNPELAFIHDGHKHVDGHNAETLITSHVWLSDISNIIISSADNGTVQLWEFEDKCKVNE